MPTADDEFSNVNPSITGPARHMFAITPDNSNDLAKVTRVLLLSADGVVKVTTVGGETLSLPLVKGWNPLQVKRVFATGTDAVDIFGGY